MTVFVELAVHREVTSLSFGLNPWKIIHSGERRRENIKATWGIDPKNARELHYIAR